MADSPNSSRSLMLIAIGIAVLLVVSFLPFAGKGKGGTPAADDEATAARIQPVAKVELKIAAQPAAGAARDAQTIFNSWCTVCHTTGVAGAPKAGDKAAWAPRLKAGIDALVKSAIAGKGAMPPKGGAADLTEAEIRAVIELMSK